LSLLAWIREKEDGSFELNDLFEIVKEELDYLEEEKIKKETEDILIIGEKIGFIEKYRISQGSIKLYPEQKRLTAKKRR
jgi:hypothetical protein